VDQSFASGSGVQTNNYSVPAQTSARGGSHAGEGTSFLGSFAVAPVLEQIPQQRPKTRQQSGIRKEKVYTDGTVKYGCFPSTGESDNLVEALDDKNWKGVMDAEYGVLIKNKT
jgi:hypothetical protein